jgi:hypothetical protein
MANTPTSSSENKFMEQVNAGIAGHNQGLDNGLTKINDYIYGTQKGRYYLLGAESGVGKTTIGDFMYVLSAWRAAKRVGKPFKIFYFSFEIGVADKMARWASQIIFLNKGKRLPSDYILGRIKGHPLSKEDQVLVREANAEIELMLKDIVLIERTLTPTEVYEAMIAFYEKNGTVTRDSVTEKEAKAGKKGDVNGWIPGEAIKQAHVILIMDHVGLINEEPGRSLKVSMDLMSKYFVALRNRFQLTIVAIQQFAAELMQANRQLQIKKSVMLLSPTRLDFGDSKALYRDADVVFGMILPALTMPIFACGWSLDRQGGLGLYLVLNFIMKNRYGTPGRAVPLFLDGVTGTVEDLPMLDNPKDVMDLATRVDFYNKARKIDEVCQLFSLQKK